MGSEKEVYKLESDGETEYILRHMTILTRYYLLFLYFLRPVQSSHCSIMSEVCFNYNSRIQTVLTEHKLARTYQIAKRLQKTSFWCFEATRRKISNMLHSTVLLHQRKFACSLNSVTKNFRRTKCYFFQNVLQKFERSKRRNTQHPALC